MDKQNTQEGSEDECIREQSSQERSEERSEDECIGEQSSQERSEGHGGEDEHEEAKR